MIEDDFVMLSVSIPCLFLLFRIWSLILIREMPDKEPFRYNPEQNGG
ncbi:hypothetical protein METP2_00095 [Methanosarcinales archaeon]|nr:hypothetical protein METP2_00095 [Methanosarcinales archaeon]